MDIGERVRLRARVQRPDVTQAELAAEVSMTPDALSRSLSGARHFSALELARLASALETSMHWLVTGEEDPHRVLVAARHTYDSVLQRHDPVDWVADSEGIASLTNAYVQVFEDEVGDPLALLPSSPLAAREALVAAFGPDFVRRFAEAVESAFLIDVVRVPDISRAYSLSVAGHRVIAVAPTANWFFQNWSIAHELAHFAAAQLTDLVGVAAESPRAERSANAFAAELLMPASEVRSIDWSTVDAAAVAERIWQWGVSTDALRIRLANLAIIPADPIRELLLLKTQKVLRLYHGHGVDSEIDEVSERMARASTRRFPTSLLRAHTDAVATGAIGAGTLGWMLDVDPLDLEAQLAPAFAPPDLDRLAEELGLDGHGPE